MHDNNILVRHIKPAARKLGCDFVNWQTILRNMVEDGESGREGCSGSNASQPSFYDDGHLCPARAGVAAASCEQFERNGAVNRDRDEESREDKSKKRMVARDGIGRATDSENK